MHNSRNGLYTIRLDYQKKAPQQLEGLFKNLNDYLISSIPFSGFQRNRRQLIYKDKCRN